MDSLVIVQLGFLHMPILRHARSAGLSLLESVLFGDQRIYYDRAGARNKCLAGRLESAVEELTELLTDEGSDIFAVVGHVVLHDAQYDHANGAVVVEALHCLQR